MSACSWAGGYDKEGKKNGSYTFSSVLRIVSVRKRKPKSSLGPGKYVEIFQGRTLSGRILRFFDRRKTAK